MIELSQSELSGIDGLAMEFAEWAMQISPEHEKSLGIQLATFLDWREGKAQESIALAFLRCNPVVQELRDLYIGPAKEVIDSFDP